MLWRHTKDLSPAELETVNFFHAIRIWKFRMLLCVHQRRQCTAGRIEPNEHG